MTPAVADSCHCSLLPCKYRQQRSKINSQHNLSDIKHRIQPLLGGNSKASFLSIVYTETKIRIIAQNFWNFQNIVPVFHDSPDDIYGVTCHRPYFDIIISCEYNMKYPSVKSVACCYSVFNYSIAYLSGFNVIPFCIIRQEPFKIQVQVIVKRNLVIIILINWIYLKIITWAGSTGKCKISDLFEELGFRVWKTEFFPWSEV